MTAPARTPQGTGPLRVSVEGINGTGKTSAVRRAAAMLGPRCLLLGELTDQPGDTLPGQVIAALATGNDPFLRTGHPAAETLALLALQVRKAERLNGQALAGVDVIVEDRGIDTVAVYQAVILCGRCPGESPEAVAEHVLSAARCWHPLPDATILLAGDLRTCARRFASRTGHPLTPADVQVMEQIDALYRAMAARDPRRYAVLDVAGKTQEETARAVTGIVAARLEEPESARAS